MTPTILGKITLFPYDFEPAGWMFCDGRKLYVGDNDALFTLFDYTFGGDGDVFALPDLRSAAPANCHYCIATQGTFRTNYYEGVLGETILSPQPELPQNMKECNGQSLARSQNRVLEMYMGDRFGGDGANIKLPDLRSKAIKKYQYQLATSGETPPSLRNRNPYVGEIILLPYETTFESLVPCDGRRLAVAQQGGLYTLLRNRFGGDAQQFAIPDLRAAAPSKYVYYMSLGGVFPPRG